MGLAKDCFSTRSSLYEYVTMPFGLLHASSTFDHCMELVLKGLQWKTLLIYLADVILFSKTVDYYLKQLDEMFCRLSEAGLKLKPSKCELLGPQVAILGKIVSKAVVSPCHHSCSSAPADRQIFAV